VEVDDIVGRRRNHAQHFNLACNAAAALERRDPPRQLLVVLLQLRDLRHRVADATADTEDRDAERHDAEQPDRHERNPQAPANQLIEQRAVERMCAAPTRCPGARVPDRT
jgi:hypothetical protein